MRKGIKKNVFWDAIAEEIFVGKILQEEEEENRGAIIQEEDEQNNEQNEDAIIQEKEQERNHEALIDEYAKELKDPSLARQLRWR